MLNSYLSVECEITNVSKYRSKLAFFKDRYPGQIGNKSSIKLKSITTIDIEASGRRSSAWREYPIGRGGGQEGVCGEEDVNRVLLSLFCTCPGETHERRTFDFFTIFFSSNYLYLPFSCFDVVALFERP